MNESNSYSLPSFFFFLLSAFVTLKTPFTEVYL